MSLEAPPKLFDDIVSTLYKEYLFSVDPNDPKYVIELDAHQLSGGLRNVFGREHYLFGVDQGVDPEVDPEVDPDVARQLDKCVVSQGLQKKFRLNDCSLGANPSVNVIQPGITWDISDDDGMYHVRKERERDRYWLNVYRSMPSPLTAMAKVRVVSAGRSWIVNDGDTEIFIRNEIRNGKQTLSWYGKRNTMVGEDATDTIASRINGRLQDLEMVTQKNGENGADWALLRLFGRLSELIVDRLEQVPEKHFLSFLNHAGIDLLPPIPAEVDLSFDLELKPDAVDDSVLMPKGTRVATLATEARPEIIFETQGDLTVVDNQLQKCITFDPVNYTDRTSLVTNVEARPFRVFEGTERRERVLYLAADRLLDFTDDASRLTAMITLKFTLGDNLGRMSGQSADTKGPGSPLFTVVSSFVNELDARRLSDALRGEFQNHGKALTSTATVVVDEAGKKWTISDTGANFSKHFIIQNKNQQLNVYPVEIEVRYWNGIEWQRIAELCVDDTTHAFSRDGKVVIRNRSLISLDPNFLNELDKGQLSEALRAQFAAEGESLTVDAKVTVQKPGSTWLIDDAGMKYLVSNENQELAVYNIPLMVKTTVGGPPISDGFLFSIDARPYVDLDLTPFKKELADALGKAARYYHVDLETPLTLTVQPGNAKTPIWELKDRAGTTLSVVQEGMQFNVSLPQEPRTWIALALTGFDEPRDFPAIASISAEKVLSIVGQQTTGDMAFSAVPANNTFVPLTLTDEFFPLGPRPALLDTFYLRSDEAFSKPGAAVQIDFEGLTGVPEDAESSALSAVEVVWEYFSTAGWTRLGSSKRREHLFSVGLDYVAELDKGKVTTIKKEFDQNYPNLVTSKAKVEVVAPGSLWRIVDGDNDYTIRNQDNTLRVSRPVKVVTDKDVDGFIDTTAAFTTGKVDGDTPRVCFKVPSGRTAEHPGFKQTTVNGVTGYWIRACLVDGSYDVPPKIPSPGLFRRNFDPQLARFFAPVAMSLRVQYGYDSTDGSAHDTDLTTVPAEEFQCLSVVDNMLRVHTSALKAGIGFHPFSANAEGPAMVVGWDKSFPAGKQIDLLMDAQEQDLNVKSPLVWEYWSGRGWMTLQVADKSQNLTRRGLVSFTAPPDFRTAQADRSISETDHRVSTEFGENAFWFRIRPGHPRHPFARPRARQTEFCPGDESPKECVKNTFTVTLDASCSKAFDDQNIVRYYWRQSTTKSGQHVKVYLSKDNASMATLAPFGDKWEVELDPSAATVEVGLEYAVGEEHAGQQTKFIWTKVSAEVRPDDFKRLVLNSIRLNNVKAQNTTTFLESIIGSSDGNRNQTFMLPGKPVLPDVQIAVRESDSPSQEELYTHEQELGAVALLPLDSKEAPGQGRWICWQRVVSFLDSNAKSRHFVVDLIVDPITGDPVANEVRFGDGRYGRIPEAGRNNIKVLRYATHNGSAGNVEAGFVTVLRNPKDALANIRSVTNPERSVGGSDVEKVEAVKQRGPQALKHRHRAVTEGSFQWLAQESTVEVERAYAMPARDRRGAVVPGWMTVIIVPKNSVVASTPTWEKACDVSVVRPYPEARLTRFVKEYLEQNASTSVFNDQGEPADHVHHIYVSGPEYVRIDLTAHIISKSGVNPNEVCKRVKDQLTEFLHPLCGGSDRKNQPGWQFGRDVFLSEIYAEIEAVQGVDRVKRVSMNSSIDQLRVYVEQPILEAERKRIKAAAAGSIISTFDDRLRMVLADPPVVDNADAQLGLPLFGFKERDRVELVNLHDDVQMDGLEIVTLDVGPDKEPNNGIVTLRAQLGWPAGNSLTKALQESDGLRSLDGRLRLPLDEHWKARIRDGLVPQPDIHGNVTIQVQRLRPNTDEICIWEAGRQEPVFVTAVNRVQRPLDRVFVPEGHLVYPGRLIVEPAVK